MNELHLPEGYRYRPPVPDDAPAVAAMIAAYEQDIHGKPEITEAWMADDWNDIDLAEEAVVVVAPGGEIVASADVLNRLNINVSIYGYVHPDYRELGLGSFLVAWGEEWARARMGAAPPDARIIVQHYLASSDERAQRLLRGRGYDPVRGYYVMHLDFDGEPPPPQWPEGITVRPFRQGEDEEATFEAHEDAFKDVWGRPKGTYERFLRMTEAEHFDPDLWYLALDGDKIAGYILSKVIDHEGWVDTLGVRRPWRRRGLGLALLRHAFGALYRRGATEAGLSVDAESLTGAPRVYERAGMRVKRSYILHQKELRPGVSYDVSA